MDRLIIKENCSLPWENTDIYEFNNEYLPPKGTFLNFLLHLKVFTLVI